MPETSITITTELAAVDENLPVTFVIWNNNGYHQIAISMEEVGVTVVGCDPTPPDFKSAAQSFGIPFTKTRFEGTALAAALRNAARQTGPALIEIEAPGGCPNKRVEPEGKDEAD